MGCAGATKAANRAAGTRAKIPTERYVPVRMCMCVVRYTLLHGYVKTPVHTVPKRRPRLFRPGRPVLRGGDQAGCQAKANAKDEPQLSSATEISGSHHPPPLELPDVPFHVFLRTWTTTALQDVMSQSRARFAQAASVEPVSTPTVSDVCEVLQAFYQDAYAQHLKQDWLVKALKIPEARRHDMEHITELFNTATEDFFLHCQQHGITDTPLSKHARHKKTTQKNIGIFLRATEISGSHHPPP